MYERYERGECFMITNLKKQEYLKRLMDLGIPEVYQTFPKDFHVDVNGWSFVDYE